MIHVVQFDHLYLTATPSPSAIKFLKDILYFYDKSGVDHSRVDSSSCDDESSDDDSSEEESDQVLFVYNIELLKM